MTRPAGHPRIWAEDDTYSSGALTGQANKVAPSDAIVARGWYPGKRRPAQWDNHELNDITRRVANLDMAEALNWIEIASVTATGSNLPGTIVAPRIFEDGLGMFVLYHTNDNDDVRSSVDGGYSWTVSHNDPGSIIYDIASSPLALAAVATEGGAAKVIARYDTGGWQTAALTSVTDARCIVQDEYVPGVFYVGGVDTATPRVVRLDTTAAVPGTQTLLSGGGGANRIDLIACGSEFKLGAISGVAGSTNVLRRWDADDTAMTAVTQATSSSILDLLWSDEDQMFYLFTSAGCWRSPTGNTASWINVSPASGMGVTFLFKGGCVRGGLVVCACEVSFGGTQPAIIITGDMGATWRVIPDPLVRHQTAPTASVQAVRNCGNRLVCFGYQASGLIQIALGFRAGDFL